MTFLITTGEEGLQESEKRVYGGLNFFFEDFEEIEEEVFLNPGLGPKPDFRSVEELPEKLKGGFTAVSFEKGLEIVRDVFGSRPVYFVEENGVHISDRIKPLLKFTDAEVNEDVALDYLHSGLVDHRRETFFAEVKQLRPGEALNYDGKLEIKDVEAELKVDKDAEKLLREEIEGRVPGEEFVCPVSGGLDSTVVAEMAEEADFVHTSFNVDTGDEKYFQELRPELGQVEEFEFAVGELLKHVDESLRIHEQPTGMIAVQAQDLLYQRISETRGGSVIVDGTGADELFYGYPDFTPYFIKHRFEKGLIPGLKAFKDYRYMLDRFRWRELLRLLIPFYDNDLKVPEIDRSDIERPNSLEEAFEYNLRESDFPHILHSMTKSSEAFDHRVIPAFLSPRLLEKARDLEVERSFAEGKTKNIVREAFREDLPDKILERKKKTGFIRLEGFRPEFSEEFDRVFGSESFQNRGFFDGELFYRRFREGFQGFFRCYRFYCLEKWMRIYMD
ncbi:MAG: asparagine synthase-related protein [Candidatus Nanohaloarchaea archaeon]